MFNKNYKRINRATLTDGKMLEYHILAPYRTTDDELLLAFNDICGDALRTYNIVHDNSATKWDNDLVSGFSAIRFDSMTEYGAGYCSATVKLKDSDSISLSIANNNTIMFDTQALEKLAKSYHTRSVLYDGYIDNNSSVSLGCASAYSHSVAKGNKTYASNYGFAIATTPMNSSAVNTATLFTTRENSNGKPNYVENHSFGFQGVDLHGEYLFGAYDASATNSNNCVILYNSTANNANHGVAIYDSYITNSHGYALWNSTAFNKGVALYGSSAANNWAYALYGSTADDSSIATYYAYAKNNSVARYGATAKSDSIGYYNSNIDTSSFVAYSSTAQLSGIAFFNSEASNKALAFRQSVARDKSIAFNNSDANASSFAAVDSYANNKSFAINGSSAENCSIADGYNSSAVASSVCYGIEATATNCSFVFAGDIRGSVADDHSICKFGGSSTVSSISNYSSTASNKSIASFTSRSTDSSIAMYNSTATVSSIAMFNSTANNKSIALYNSNADNETLAMLNNSIEINSRGQYNGVAFSYSNGTLTVA